MMYGGVYRGTIVSKGLCVKVRCPECGEPTVCWKSVGTVKDYQGVCSNCWQAVQIRGVF